MTAVSGNSPLRVLFVSGIPLGTATCRYRCEQPAEALRKSGAQADVVYIGQSRVRVAHDIVVLYRVCANRDGWRFARAARACGAVLVYSTDDVVFDAEAAPPEMGNRFRALAPLHREMLREADAALASTEYLAQWMQRAVPDTPVHFLRNFLGSDLVNLSETARKRLEWNGGSERVTMSYLSGSPTHDNDLASIAGPLGSVLEANPEAELLLVGPVRTPEALEAREAAGQVRRMPSVSWRALPTLVAEQKVTLNLAPLELTREFCHAKSEVKFLEAAALGIPTVASAAKGFWESIPGSDGESGCFLAATPSEWEARLNFLIQHKAERRESGARAYQQARAVGAEGPATQIVRGVFETLADLRLQSPASDNRGTMVNWPFSPRYALKGALERGVRLRMPLGNR